MIKRVNRHKFFPVISWQLSYAFFSNGNIRLLTAVVVFQPIIKTGDGKIFRSTSLPPVLLPPDPLLLPLRDQLPPG
jgi:hypothetical protein